MVNLLNNLLLERYRVIKVLRTGRFCQTYTAQDLSLPTQPICIIKHFLPSRQYPLSPILRQRLFIREVEALQKLNHYNRVPRLLAHFEDNTEFFLVQEFIEGHLLQVELLPGHRWSEIKVIQLLQEVLNILEFIHSQGLIHRDLKPSNIIRRKQDNQLVLIDFGAVKPVLRHLTKAQGKAMVAAPNELYTTIAIGTPGYMPHEQERGKPRLNSDIYALGMIAIQALTGVHPKQLTEDYETGELLWQHQAQASVPLTTVLNKMVCYHFKDRYKSASEALQALEPLVVSLKLQQPVSPRLNLSKVLEYQTFLSEQDTQQASEDTVVAPGDEQTNRTTVPISFSNLSWQIGLVLGIVSGVILMVVSYYSLQLPAHTPNPSQPSVPHPTIQSSRKSQVVSHK